MLLGRDSSEERITTPPVAGAGVATTSLTTSSPLMSPLPMNRLPRHVGNLSPVYTASPVGAIDGSHSTIGCSMPSLSGAGEIRGEPLTAGPGGRNQ